MRLLHVVPTYIPAWRYGGPIYSVHGLCKALAARGHEVHVATTNVDGKGDTPVSLTEPVDIEGVAVHYFPSTRLRRLYRSPPMHRFMSRSIERWDLVHTHSVFLWPTTSAARLARQAHKPYVVSPRGMLVRDLIERRQTLIKRLWIAAFEARNINHAAAIHATSRSEAEEILALGLEPRRIFEIPNGVDLPPPGAAAPAPDPNLPGDYVLFLGRISWKKGLDRLLRAMALTQIPLVVAGNDDENYWPGMAQLAETLGIAARVHYVGRVDGARKESLLRHASMLVLPSYSENFGNVVLEAMAVATPVIVTPEVGLATAMQEHGSGIVAQGDAPALSAAISSLRSDASARSAFAERGRAMARAYSWDSIAERFEREYRAICDEHR
jgi:glycosyltransferase involved in cell wall biosynthesis